MSSITKVVTLILIGMVVMVGFSPQAMAQLEEGQRQRVDNKLGEVASLLAVQLQADEVFRAAVLERTKDSRRPEQRVDLESMLAEERASAAQRVGLGYPRGGAGIWSVLQSAVEELKQEVAAAETAARAARSAIPRLGDTSVATAPTRFDLYFPVAEHRQKWDGGGNLLIARAPVDDEAPGEMVGYRVGDQAAVALDPGRAPDTPTLVVGINERRSDELAPPMVTLPADAEDPNEPNPIAPRADDTNSYIGVPYIKLLSDSEPWYKGDPELYVWVTRWVVGVGAINQKIQGPLAKVNDVGIWYYLGDGPCWPLYFFFNNDCYGKVTRFEFWEEDWPDAEDFMGVFDVNRDTMNWCGYSTRCDRCVCIQVDKDP